MKFLVYNHASLLEGTTQCEFLHAIYPDGGWDIVSKELDNLGGKIYRFIEFVESKWETDK